jgi:hypothetical protein
MCERGKDDVEFCGSRDSDLTSFGEGKKLSLLQFLIYIIDYRLLWIV